MDTNRCADSIEKTGDFTQIKKFVSLGDFDPSALIDTWTLAEATEMTASFYEKGRRTGSGPPFLRLGGPVRGAVRYRVRDVMAWLETREVRPATSVGK